MSNDLMLIDLTRESRANGQQVTLDIEDDSFQNRFYHLIRNLFAFLVSTGSPLNDWLKSDDTLRISYNKYKALWILNRIYCWLWIHSTLALNIWLPIHLSNLVGIATFTTFIVWNLSAALIMDWYYLCGGNIRRILVSIFAGEESSDETLLASGEELTTTDMHYLTKMLKYLPIFCHILLVLSICFAISVYLLPLVFYTLSAFNVIYVSVNLFLFIKLCSALGYQFVNLSNLTQKCITEENMSPDVMAIINSKFINIMKNALRLEKLLFGSLAFYLIILIALPTVGLIIAINVGRNGSALLLFGSACYLLVTLLGLYLVIALIIRIYKLKRDIKTSKLIINNYGNRSAGNQSVEFKILFLHYMNNVIAFTVNSNLFRTIKIFALLVLTLNVIALIGGLFAFAVVL